MKLSSYGAKFIKDREGLRLKAYRCSANKWTIGWGHTKTVKQGMVITQKQAEALFVSDVMPIEDAMARLIKVTINQNQYDAIVSFIFNIGITAFAASTLLSLLNARQFTQAAEQFMRWNKIKDGEKVKIDKGLTNRRALEKELFLSPVIILPKETQPMKYLTLFQALKQGYALTHAETWRNVSNATALLTSLLSALLSFAITSGMIPDGLITGDALAAMSSGIVSIVTLLLAYFGVATDKNAGV